MAAVDKSILDHKLMFLSEDMLMRLDVVARNLPILEGEWLRRSFHRFVEAAWPIIEPGKPFQDNWHIQTLCDHLEAVANGTISRLIINIPPRFAKSTLVSVLWPVWIWINFPSKRFLTGSFSKELATRDAVVARRLMESEWFKARFGHLFRFTTDQNVKTRYENDKRGYRVVTSVDAGATGEGGDYLIVDDPVSAKEANSPIALETAITWWRETMSTRYNDPKSGAAVVVMQRLAENDLTGYLLKQGGWEHLVFPMRYEKGETKTTVLGFVDPRKEEGELLHPDRFDEESTARLERELGSYGAAGQLQQRPSPRGGAIFKRVGFQYYRQLPELDEVVITADCTFKDKQTSDYVAIQAWGRKGANKYLLKKLKDHLNFTATQAAIRSFKATFPKAVAVLIEDKANGTAVIETLQKEVAGIIAVNPEGGKIARAFAVQPEFEAGNIFIPDPTLDPTIEDYITEMTSFTGSNSGTDDQVDATTQCLNWLRNRTGSMNVFEYYRQQAEALAKSKQGAK